MHLSLHIVQFLWNTPVKFLWNSGTMLAVTSKIATSEGRANLKNGHLKSGANTKCQLCLTLAVTLQCFRQNLCLTHCLLKCVSCFKIFSVIQTCKSPDWPHSHSKNTWWASGKVSSIRATLGTTLVTPTLKIHISSGQPTPSVLCILQLLKSAFDHTACERNFCRRAWVGQGSL